MAARRRAGREEVLDSIYIIVAQVLILVACVELCDAASVVDVYRLIQYDLSGAPLGSRLAGLNHHAGAAPFASGADLSRTAVIMPIRELNLTFLRDYITNRRPLGGLLLLLPQKSNEKIVGEIKKLGINNKEAVMRNILVELEQLLIHANIPYPVYFAFEDDKINAALADVRKSDMATQPATATTGGYKLVLSSPEPKKLVSPTLTNIQGWLSGLKGKAITNQLPTIAIVASYDTFGASPALSVGSDSNGSGVVALLEIARLFSRLYSNPKTRGKYNLLFGLTSGGPYNYNGTLKWLRSSDQRLRESIDYAICLNGIGSWNNELWMHVSKPPENAYVKQVYDSLSSVAKEMGIAIGIKHKKINISNPRVAWEHEQFSRLRVTAMTLSELSSPPEFLESTGGLFDTRSFVDETAIYRSVKLVAESLAYIKKNFSSGWFTDGITEVNASISPPVLTVSRMADIKHLYSVTKNESYFNNLNHDLLFYPQVSTSSKSDMEEDLSIGLIDEPAIREEEFIDPNYDIPYGDDDYE
ncbi:LOW QUALITY PROTEIN: nicalin-like [Dioscorea cayenensis subsp. rotundata]|uniref:LOW QUALITY PROTEIN: nicalin-like n=1 Tax=Dioscorea cayennensis subsp. rotundata TaxID=55577 RepID=A0AB40B4F3_DIOCR|nr:LOW QUALITY PROTEIN: nicalin-like [Dioscorea cayenensis subsp. rotundata]